MGFFLIVIYSIPMGLWLAFLKVTKRPEPSEENIRLFTAIYITCLSISLWLLFCFTSDSLDIVIALKGLTCSALLGLGLYAYIRMKWKTLSPKDDK